MNKLRKLLYMFCLFIAICSTQSSTTQENQHQTCVDVAKLIQTLFTHLSNTISATISKDDLLLYLSHPFGIFEIYYHSRIQFLLVQLLYCRIYFFKYWVLYGGDVHRGLHQHDMLDSIE